METTISNKGETVITFSEEEYKNSSYNTKDWEQSVNITNWEHNYEKGEYIIKYTEIC